MVEKASEVPALAVTLDCHETIRDGIKGSRLEVMKGCSHMTMDEQPDAYNALLKPFIT